MVLVCVSLLSEEKAIMEVNQIRKQYFWDNNFLNKREKRELDRNMKVYVYSHYVAWLITIVMFITMCTAPYFPQPFYNDHWSSLKKNIAKTAGYLYVLFGYYLLNAHECFFAYTILHSYFQLNILRAYLLHELERYEETYLNKKLNSYRYQALVEGALLRCIKQHKIVLE